MKIAYFDCFSGASGDMILGALLDAGLTIEKLREEIAKLRLSHYDLEVEKVVKKGIGGSQAHVIIDQDHHEHHHRHLSHILEIIDTSELSPTIKEKSTSIFRRLAEAEARVHRSSIEEVHFHEVGAMDSIIDVVGGVIGLETLGIEKIYCSPLHVGSGTIECAHGTLPVPAPATAELIQDIPVYSTGVRGELLTPTGAAILTTLASGFGPMPAMTLLRTGYGAGTADPGIPNLLRLSVGEVGAAAGDLAVEQAAVLETNIDDMNPQLYDYLIDQLLGQGALDVMLTPIQMKKNRPGTLLSVICPPDAVGRVSDLLLKETTTIGLRWRVENRICAQREIQRIDTDYGSIRVKVARNNGHLINLQPEYDDCKRAALEKKIPLKTVMDETRSAAMAAFGRLMNES